MYTPKMQKPPLLTVSQLNNYIKGTLGSDPRLQIVMLTGEITDLRSPFSPHRHNYFALKDSQCVISAAMFMGSARSVRFRPENGMKIICRCRVDFYPPYGKIQVIVEDMQPDGIGALALAFEQLKQRLAAQGLFDTAHKKPLPAFPATVGVITSPTGAAFQDIKRNLYSRFPCVNVVLYPTLVQGDQAPAQLVRAVQELDASGLCDVIIIGRGGGSAEDLWAFNDEALAHAIYHCHTPIISAVGHEIDFSICDFVADVRAATPTEAAVRAVPDQRDLRAGFDAVYRRLTARLSAMYDERHKHLLTMERIVESNSPQHAVERLESRLRLSENRMNAAMTSRIQNSEAEIRTAASRLEAVNPLSILSRGYTVTEKDGNVVTRKGQLSKGDEITIIFSDGKLNAAVTETD